MMPSDALSYDSETGIFRWKITSGKGVIGCVAGTPTAKGYIEISVKGKRYLAHRLAWLLSKGKWPSAQIDHIDGDKKNNRLSNLRLATNSQNHANRGAQKNSTSGIKGVYFWKTRGVWKSQIVVNGRNIFLGYHQTKEAAAAAYAAAAAKHFGEYAHGKNIVPRLLYEGKTS